MKSKFLSLVIAILAPMTCNSTGAVAEDSIVATQYRPRVGEPHPDFVLPNIEDGKLTALSQFRGKKVLLMHFASW